jgi:cob(I)alamin adenosyltransferase
MPIYTRTGDMGETSLFGGKRIKKHMPVVDLYGSFDELNSWIGLVIISLKVSQRKDFLEKLERDIFTIEAYLSGWKDADLSFIPARVSEMEIEIDVMDKELTELHNFILPGGSVGAAHAHITRTVCRRVERKLVAFYHSPEAKEFDDKKLSMMIQFINRLSDLFFELARFINKDAGVSDVVWKGIKK